MIDFYIKLSNFVFPHFSFQKIILLLFIRFPKQCNKIIPKTGVNRILKKTQAPFSLPSRTVNLEAHPIKTIYTTNIAIL